MVTRTRKIPDMAVLPFVINMSASDTIMADRYREVTTIAVLYIVLFFLRGLIITVKASIPSSRHPHKVQPKTCIQLF